LAIHKRLKGYVMQCLEHIYTCLLQSFMFQQSYFVNIFIPVYFRQVGVLNIVQYLMVPSDMVGAILSIKLSLKVHLRILFS